MKQVSLHSVCWFEVAYHNAAGRKIEDLHVLLVQTSSISEGADVIRAEVGRVERVVVQRLHVEGGVSGHQKHLWVQL